MGEAVGQKEVWIGETAETPLGTIWVAVSERGLVAVSLWHEREPFVAEVRRITRVEPVYNLEHTQPFARQIAAYLKKERRDFDFPIDWSVLSAFQETVLRRVAAIPYGRTLTYGDVAQQIGQPAAVRAVGRANATNPMAIVIPCHRVLGADGKLHGYSAPGGLETKAWLLRLEGSWLV